MNQLHELLAVLGDRSNTAKAVLDETETTFTKRADHFRGQTRSAKFIDENRAAENVSETKAMVTTVHDKIDYTLGKVGKYWDTLLQQEDANTRARADLVVDGTVLMKDVPATFLLGMEQRLKNLRNVLLAAPTLDPALVWRKDESAGEHVYRTDTVTGHRTEKKLQHKVLYDATEQHPAQIERWHEDVVVATIETVHTSGMLSPAEKSAMLGRADKLIAAVKKARQRANCVEVSDIKISSLMFDYIKGV